MESRIYAVCAIRRASVAGYFWASWWTSSAAILGVPSPDAHGIVDDRRLAHERARAAILDAKGARASVLQLDAEMAVEAARIVRPAREGYLTGESARSEEASSGAPFGRRSVQTRGAWLSVLQLSWPCSLADVRTAYRRLARERHPDHGGTDAAFDKLTKAYKAALTEVKMANSG